MPTGRETAGDDREFLDFFADEFWSLRRVGFLLTGDWGEAEELAQDAMARTFAAWPPMRSPASHPCRGTARPRAPAPQPAAGDGRRGRHGPGAGGRGRPGRGQGRRRAPAAEHGSTEGWKTYTEVAGNLRFRYPPDWRVKAHRARGGGRATWPWCRQGSRSRRRRRRRSASLAGQRAFWIGENWHGTTSLGRLPNGRSYLRTVIDPVADEVQFASWSIDWGRPCRTGAARCVPHSVGFQVRAADGRLWDRYRAVAETIPTTVEQLRPTAPTVGDRRLPVCRPGQWRLTWVEEYGVITVPGMDPAPRALRVPKPCKDRGRPSVVAGWPS